MTDARDRAAREALFAALSLVHPETCGRYGVTGFCDCEYQTAIDAYREAGAAESAARICTCNPMDLDCPARAALAGEPPTTEEHDG